MIREKSQSMALYLFVKNVLTKTTFILLLLLFNVLLLYNVANMFSWSETIAYILLQQWFQRYVEVLPSITASGNGQVEYLVVILHLSVSFEDTNEDYLMVADTIGVNRSTARGIVARYIREGRIAEQLYVNFSTNKPRAKTTPSAKA